MSRDQINQLLPDRFKRWNGQAVQRSIVPLDHAKQHSEAADDANRQLNRLIETHLAGLLGDWVHGTFGRLLESASEHHAETVWNYAEALLEADTERKRSLEESSEARHALVMVAERLQARYAKAHKPMLEQIEQIVIIAAAKVGWDYLFPPGDERHRHDTNSGGACRNPACTYNSDLARNNQIEPF